MASLEFYGKDEYGNGNSINLPDFTGCLLLATTPTPPAGTLVADGSEVSREAYAKLFAIFGTQYGAGDGVSTFALPDWRDEFPRFNGTSRMVGTTQTDAIRNITGGFAVRAWGTVQNPIGEIIFSMSGPFYDGLDTNEGNPIQDVDGVTRLMQNVVFDVSRVVPTADENRPRNVAFLPCVIYV